MKHRIRLSKEVAKHMKDYEKNILEKSAILPNELERAAGEATLVGVPPVKLRNADVPMTEEPAQEEVITSFQVVTRTDVGKVRSSNQDAVIHAGRLVGVADGMGGHQGGEIASAGARDGLIANLKNASPDPTTLSRAIKAVNRRLFIRSQENANLRGMGTTLSVLWIGNDCVYVGHVGDSRIYLLRGGEFKQITDDHSVVMELVRAGMITKEQAETHPMRNVITRAVGTEGGLDVDMQAVTRQKGDIWMICSDGLHGLVSDSAMAEMLQNNPPEKAADLLLQAALDAGGRDNVSLVIVVDKEGAQ